MEKGEGSRRKGRKFKSGSGEREGGGSAIYSSIICNKHAGLNLMFL